MRTGGACFRLGWVLVLSVGLSACGGSAKSGGSSGEGAEAASSGGSGDSTATGTTSGDSGSSGGASSGSTGSDASSGAGNGNSSGGSASNTTSTGGTAGSGGGDDTSVGGAAGSGGSSATGGASSGDCTTAEDCELFQDCCSCRAVAVGSQQASCRLACDEPACDAEGVSEADVACLAGRCVINRSCDDRYVLCDVATPNCEAGTLPEVEDGCYTGNCREITQCSWVSSCDVCKAADLACVTFSTLGGPTYQCVATREGCDPLDCGCMGVCNSPFICDAGEDTLHCSCLAC